MSFIQVASVRWLKSSQMSRGVYCQYTIKTNTFCSARVAKKLRLFVDKNCITTMLRHFFSGSAAKALEENGVRFRYKMKF